MAKSITALEWFAGDDTGLSSKAILRKCFGMDDNANYRFSNHPYDPCDLGRCLRMLRKMPWARDGIRLLALEFPAWAWLLAEWDALAACMANEVGIDWSHGERAPVTYAYMQELLTKARN